MNIDPALLRQICFQPPYCPNPKCDFHQGFEKEHGLSEKQDSLRQQTQKKLKLWHSFGWEKIKRHPYRMRRFRCTKCLRGFRYSSFKLQYREKRPGLNAKIFRLFI